MKPRKPIMEQVFKQSGNSALIGCEIGKAQFNIDLSKNQWNFLIYAIFELNKKQNFNSNCVSFNLLDYFEKVGCYTKKERTLENGWRFAVNEAKKIQSLQISNFIRVQSKNGKEKIKYTNSVIISSIEYIEGKITCYFNERLLKEFQQLTKQFTYIDLKTFINFEYKYSKRMYIYFKNFLLKSGKNSKVFLTKLELEAILGYGYDKYNNKVKTLSGSDLRKIVELSLKDINVGCKEFNLGCEIKKNGSTKAIEQFKFEIIRLKKQKQYQEKNEAQELETIKDNFRDWELN